MTDNEASGSAYRWQVMGRPIPKGRPRMTRTGRVYTPAATLKAERAFAAISAAHAPPEPLEGGLTLRLEYVFEPAKSWSKKKKASALGGELAHTTRPDLDNLVKLTSDALEGIFFKNDTQIVRIEASKRYGAQALTRVEILQRSKGEGRSEVDRS